MKKVLFFLESLAGGGAEKVLTDIVCNLDKSKYDITVCTVTDKGVYEEKVKSSCCNYKSLIKMDSYSKGLFGKLFVWLKTKIIYKLPAKIVYKLFVKDKYDIEIAFVEGFATKLIANSSNANSKKIAWVHIDMISNPYADNSFLTLEEHKQCYQKYASIVCVSKDTEKQFKEKFNIPNTVVVYNPIDKENIVKNINNHYELKNEIIISAVGRLENQKGFDRLIEILSKVIKINEDFKLNIIGTGSQKNQLTRLIEKYGLNEKVFLLGFMDNPYKEMAKSNLLICSSRSEGYSLVIAEAMCLGLPILTTKCAGPIELTDNGKYGILVDNNENALYDAIVKILSNPHMLYDYHEKSLLRSEIFDIKRTIREVETIFDE